MQRLLCSIGKIKKKFRCNKNIKINKFDFQKLTYYSRDICNLINNNVFFKEKINLFKTMDNMFLELFSKKFSHIINTNNLTMTVLEYKLDIYENYINTLKLPIALNMINILSHKQYGIVILSYDLISKIMEYLFGNSNFFSFKYIFKKKFTNVELKIVKKITQIIIISYNKIFKKIFATSIQYIFSEDILDVKEDDRLYKKDIFLFTIFKVYFSKSDYGIFRICIPVNIINKLKINSAYLSEYTNIINFKKRKQYISKKNIYNCNLILNVKLLENTISLFYIIRLQQGDILPILEPNNAIIYIDNYPIFKGIYKIVNQKNSVCVHSTMNINKEKIMNQDNIFLDKDKILKNDTNSLNSIQKLSKSQNKKIECEDDKKQILKNNTSDLLNNCNHIFNIPVKITVKLGQITTKIKDLLEISKGAILVLDKNIGDPLEIFINQSLIAKGEMVMVDNQYGIRITNIIDTSKFIENISS